jgi:hypothetical protein
MSDLSESGRSARHAAMAGIRQKRTLLSTSQKSQIVVALICSKEPDERRLRLHQVRMAAKRAHWSTHGGQFMAVTLPDGKLLGNPNAAAGANADAN